MKYTLLLLCLGLIHIQAQAQDYPGADWEKVAHPAFYGWNTEMLSTLQEYVVDSTMSTGMLLIQDGKVVYEYGNVVENSYIASCRKSILAMLYGNPVADGTIRLDKSLAEMNITYDGLLTETEQQATIKDIISSRSGIYLPASNGGDMLHLAPERGSVQPGEQWLYSNWDFNMAGYIFEQETGKNIYDEIERQLAVPLGMQDWDRTRQKKDGDRYMSDILAYHIDFSARDMARIGLLMLNDGKWKDKQVLPEGWVAEMVAPSTTFEELDAIAPFVKNKYSQTSYGYMWWLWDEPRYKMLEGAYAAQGAWGQNITVIPKLDMVIVIKTNDLYERQGGDHAYMIDLIARSFDQTFQKELKPLGSSLEKGDVAQFISDYEQSPPNAEGVDFQNAINLIAYQYLERADYENAIALFQLNVRQYPDSWLVYDGLGEAFYAANQYKSALVNYEKAKAINIENQWGYADKHTYIIKRIKAKL